MAVNWLKGLVAPAAQFGSPQGALGSGPPVDAPPLGGSANPYGVMPAPMQPQAQGLQPMPAPSGTTGTLPDASHWSTGTRTQGATGAPGAGLGGDSRIAMLEARCAELANDVASLALFARTLLTMLEEGKVVTRTQFTETKNRLDALDGRIDDR
jgi:hypothetical protein